MRDEILAALKEFLTVDVAVDVWDEAPKLAIIVRGPNGLGFDPMPVPENIWGAAPVYRVVHAVAHTTQMFSEHGQRWVDDDESLLGVVLFSEGWGVSSKVTGDEYKEIQAYVEAGGRLADHPKGIECKMVNAVLTEGDSLILTYFRGGEFLDDNASVEGRIPDALSELLAAFQPVAS